MKKILFTLYAVLCFCKIPFAQTIDLTFGSGGGIASLASLGFNIDDRNVNKALQADGKILLAGTKNGDFAIARLNTNGSLDGSFGVGGIATIDLAGNQDIGQGIAVQPDGKIVMVGYQYSYYQTNCRTVYYSCGCGGWSGCSTCSYYTCDYYYNYDYGIIRLNIDGTLDNSFGSAGKKIISHIASTLNGIGAQEVLNAVTVKGDGKIIAAGYENNQMVLFRFNTDGSLDNNFNSGYRLYTLSNYTPQSVIVRNDGKILVNTNQDLFQVNDNSTPDAGFGSSGIVTIANTTVTDAKINSNGKVLVTGYRYTASPQSYLWVVRQYNINGSLDNSFGSAGESIIDFNNVFNNYQEELAYSLAIDPIDNIYVGGYVYYPNTTFADLAFAKLKPDGTLDASFGNAGKFTDGAAVSDYSGAMLLQSDGKLLSFSSSQYTVKRFTNLETTVSCPADVIVQTTANSCDAVVNNIDPIISTQGSSVIVNYKLEKAGITLETGTGTVSGKTYTKGITTVTYTIDNEPSKTCSFTVTVKDEVKPTVITKNITVQLDNSGAASITPADINDGSTDNCTIDHYSLNISSFDCSNVGANTVILTVTDVNGNSDSKTATVTVKDEVKPTVVTQNITVQLNAAGTASITPAQINNGSSDNCSISGYSLDKTSFDCSNVGANTVILTVTDVNGNSDSKTATVTVKDEVKPTVVTQNITVQLNTAGTATITPAQINNGSSDNCSISSYSLDITSFDCSNVGANTVILTVTDVNGNSDSKTATVTVKDEVKPTVVTQNITVQLNAAGTASITPAQINNGSADNCSIASYSLDKTSFDCSNVGANTVILTVTDVNGNSDSKTATVTVKDEVKPTVVTQNITVQLNTAGTATITPAQINNGSSDNCSISGYSLDKTSFDCSNVGANTVILTVTDVNGNSESNTATVTVKDEVKPTVFTQNITVQLNAAGTATITPAQINNGSSDNCSISGYSLDKTSFDCSNVGANTVILTVTDVNGNSDSKTATVTVKDEVKPTVVTQNITVQLNAAGTASITPAQINNGSSDNCSISSYSLDITSFDCSNVGANTVILTVTDVNGNSDSKTATVTVKDEVKPTVVTQNITVQLNAAGTATITPAQINNGSSDNCSISGYSLDKTGFDCSNVGANTVILTVTDVNGNSDSKTATVTVKDEVKPTVVTQNITVQLNAAGTASITPAQINNGSSDNCSISGYSLDKTSFDCSNVGANTVILTVTDVNGNSDSKTATVTVKDEVKPTVVTQNITVQLNAAGTASITPAQINNGSSDNCSISGYSLDKTSFDCSSVGANTVILTVTDVNGNSDSKNATVTVKDEEKPTVVTQNITVQLNAAGTASITPAQINNGSSDNCSISGYSLDKTSFDCSNVGSNTVILTVTDVNSNTQTGTATVTVKDEIKPTVVTQNITVQLGAMGTATITPSQINNGSADNCSIPANGYSLSKTIFDCTNIGSNTVTLTVTDVNGNSQTGTAIVTVTALNTTTSVTVTPSPRQYSDEVTFAAAVTPGQVTGGCQAATQVSFYLGTRLMGTVPLVFNSITNKLTGTLITALSEIGNTGSVKPSTTPKNVKAVFGGISAAFIVPDATTTLTIKEEDCRAEYTGAMFVSTPTVSLSSSVTVTVPLLATLQDISVPILPADPLYDANKGNISRAYARFILRENNTAISGWLPVGLLFANDSSTGTVAFNWSVTLGSNLLSDSYTIGIEVGGPDGYYKRNSTNDDVAVTVSRPSQDFMTGGGYLIPNKSAGDYASDAGRKMNFGFNAKYNKSGKNQQGKANIIFRRMQNDGLHIYQIKSNSIISVGINAANPLNKKGTFVSKANLTDVTNPLLPIAYGNHTLQMDVEDNGEPGNLDSIAITLTRNDGRLLYSSNWVSTKTVSKKITGGNIQVSSAAAAIKPVITEVINNTSLFTVKIYPNPSSSIFILKMETASREPVEVRIIDALGRTVEIYHAISSHQAIRVGNNLKTGIYMAEVKQGQNAKTLKLIKQ